MSVISETLTGLRLRKNMEREQLAYELGISVSAITKFETCGLFRRNAFVYYGRNRQKCRNFGAYNRQN